MISLPQTRAVLVRKMMEEDITPVMLIDQASFSLPWSERSYRFDLLENKAARLWVAETHADGGVSEIIGMVVLWIIVDEAHIGTLAVHPSYRRQGIGRKILERALADAETHGVLSATLEVRRSNQAACQMYAAMGFEIVGVRPRYYKDNDEDALLMTAELTQISLF
jgi:[ribosomal protein S18]-alanine N-acetyltransferase